MSAAAAKAWQETLKLARQTRQLSAADRASIASGARAEKAKRSLFEFLKQSWHVHEPGVTPLWNWHIEVFCWHVQLVLEGWLVANGKGTPAMRRRQIELWERHGLTFEEHSLLVQNMILNLPPITLKSRILMVIAPAWLWLHAPAFEWCAISSVDDNVKRDSNAHRDLIESHWYRASFGITWRIKKKQDSVQDWHTTAGGTRKSRTTLGGFTGVHVDGLLLDDPDDAFQVWSMPARLKVQGKWTTSIKNRIKQPDISIRLAIQQRVHIDDWTSAQVNKGIWKPHDRMAWAWVVIPLHYGRGPEDAPTISPYFWSDPREAANDNLHAERFSEAFIADEIRDKGPEGFEAQYNQNPASLEGGMIKRAYVRFFRLVDDPISIRKRPTGTGIDQDGNVISTKVIGYNLRGEYDIDEMIVTLDCSNGSEQVTASAVGLGIVFRKGNERFVVEDRTDVMGIEEMYQAVFKTIRDYPVRKILIELKAAGASVINAIRKELASGNLKWPNGKTAVVEIVTYTPGPYDSKESRAAAMQPEWAAGLWHVREGADWLYPKIVGGGKVVDPGFIGEVCTFPRSKRDDRIDMLSQLSGYWRDTGDAKSRWRAMARA